MRSRPSSWLSRPPPGLRALRSEAASESLALPAIAFRNLPGTATSPWACARRRGALPCCYHQELPGRIVPDTHKPSLVPPMRNGKNATKRRRFRGRGTGDGTVSPVVSRASKLAWGIAHQLKAAKREWLQLHLQSEGEKPCLSFSARRK